MCFRKWGMVIAAVSLITLSGCSHTASPVESAIGENTYSAGERDSSNHSLLGLYSFVCRPEAGTVEIIPLRNADLHLNALKFLEPPAFLYLTIEGPPQFNGNILDVDIGLRHPFLGQNVDTVFDVCGIMFTHGAVTGFNDPDVVMAGEGDTRLLNADGYTRWWNPAEFPHGETKFNYIDGMFGNPADTSDFNCTLNGYKYFADGLEKDEPLSVLTPEQRGVFSAGTKNIRHYTIDLSGEPEFNYAVDACWKKPSVIPPQNIPGDFPPGANRPEAWNVRVTEVTNTLYYEVSTGSGGGELELLIDVWDHFDADANEVRAESSAGFPLTTALTPVGGGEGFSTYEIDFIGEDLIQSGDADILITVESDTTGYGSLLPGKPVCAYFKHSFNIDPKIYLGWARTWGGTYIDYGHGVAIDESGNAYITGQFRNTVDFDPGPGVDEHTTNDANDSGDIFLSKFDPNGDLQWACTWGGSVWDTSYGVAIDGSGNVYVTGYYRDTVDFDPGPGVDEHTSNGHYAFLSKFDSTGVFQWARTWGGSGHVFSYDVAIDGSDNAYITGNFIDSVDFDPGPGVDEHISNGHRDIFLSKFDPEGVFQWVCTWGGDDDPITGDASYGVAIDGSGNAYVTGQFRKKVDFDPGPGEDDHISNGEGDIFLSKFDSAGVFQWARTWGGSDEDWGFDVVIDGSGNAYVTGAFWEAVDFNPGPGVDEHTSHGYNDIFLSKFDSSGNFLWACTWGGTLFNNGHGVAVDGSGNAYVTGSFRDTVDFNPGPGVDEHTSNGYADIFLCKFDSASIFQWAHTWGGSDYAFGSSVAIDGSGNIYVAGDFRDTVDFNPGPGEDEHTSHGYDDAFLSKFPPDGNW